MSSGIIAKHDDRLNKVTPRTATSQTLKVPRYMTGAIRPIEHDPERRIWTKHADFAEPAAVLPGNVASQTKRSSKTRPASTIGILSSDEPKKSFPEDIVSLDEALRLENKCLNRACSLRRKRPTKTLQRVDYSDVSVNPSKDFGCVKAATSGDKNDDTFAFSDAEDSGSEDADFSVQSPNSSSFLLHLHTPKSFRSVRFKGKLAPIQEYEEE